AGLCSCAPALLVMRPAGTAPRRRAQVRRSTQYCCSSAVGSASASALATRLQVPWLSASSAWPCLVLRRYFLCQMSTDAGCIGMSCFVSVATASSLAVLMFVCAPVLVPVRRCRLRVVPAHRRGGDDAAA